MKALTFALTLFVFAGTADAQSEVSVNATASVIVPADKILFSINLNAEGANPQEAYKLHKKREKVLVNQLKKHDISEKNIQFEPISIHKSYNNDYPKEKRKRIQTKQNVSLTLHNFDVYEQIQITLIENGFNDFKGGFGASKSKESKDEALKKALQTARDKADIIASQTGLTITGIKNISYSYNQRPPQPMQMMIRSESTGNLLEKYDQSISISARVAVTYNSDQ